MHTEQGNKRTKLAPASLQLTPLLQVLVLHLRAVIELLGCHIAVLHTETALIHTPEGQSRHGVVQTSGHLCPHVFPAGTNIATPCCRRKALFAGKTAARQQEHALVGQHGTLTIVDSVGIDDAIGVEILRGSTKSRRTTECLAIPHGRTVADIGL